MSYEVRDGRKVHSVDDHESAMKIAEKCVHDCIMRSEGKDEWKPLAGDIAIRLVTHKTQERLNEGESWYELDFVETKVWQQLQDELRQGREAVEKLPVTADGVRVSWGDEVWYMLTSGEPCKITIRDIAISMKGKHEITDGWRVLTISKECFSTSEACVEADNLIKEQRESK